YGSQALSQTIESFMVYKLLLDRARRDVSTKKLSRQCTRMLIIEHHDFDPPTMVAWMPSAFCFNRGAPVGRSCTGSGICGPIVEGSKITRSAMYPLRTSPRPCRPQNDAMSNVIFRTAASKVKACFSRTQ